MDPESSGGLLPAQTGPQQPQLLADAGKSPSKPQPLKTFYKGEPLALGITQILIGIVLIAFGIMINFLRRYHEPPYLVLRVPCWTGALFTISGSLTVAAANNPKIALVKGMLGMNVVSAVAAGLGLLFFVSGEFVAFYHAWDHSCSDLNPETDPICYEAKVIAWGQFPSLKEFVACIFLFLTDFLPIQLINSMNFYRLGVNVESGMMMILLVFTIVELGLAITTAAFGCSTLCRDTYGEKVVVVYQHRPQDNTVSSPPAGGDAETV